MAELGVIANMSLWVLEERRQKRSLEKPLIIHQCFQCFISKSIC